MVLLINFLNKCGRSYKFNSLSEGNQLSESDSVANRIVVGPVGLGKKSKALFMHYNIT